jgi:hypothetical protein
MNCHDIVFSQKQSQNRIEKALQVIPSLALKKILFFSLYVFGAKLNEIADCLEMPKESGKTTINRVMRDGIPAFHDRRQSVKTNELQSPQSQDQQISLLIENDCCILIFGNSNQQLKIPLCHKVHLKSVLLSLFQANLLSVQTVSSVLGITEGHCRELSTKLANDGVTEVLIDKRKGQKQDFLVDLSVKAELIQHFAARAVTGHSISSQALTELINDAQNTAISSRTIRWHMNKLGLMKIKKTLPDLVENLKKTPNPDC